MKTESRLCREYVSNSNDPARLNHQNDVGTTTRFFRSVAYHWTKKRVKKNHVAQPTDHFPDAPIDTQKFAVVPDQLMQPVHNDRSLGRRRPDLEINFPGSSTGDRAHLIFCGAGIRACRWG